MPRRSEHYFIAEELLLEGEAVVRKINNAKHMFDNTGLPYPHDAEQLIRARRDDLGKQAMGIWAQAQVHATLASARETAPTGQKETR